MDIETELYKQNPWWRKEFIDNSIKRETYVNEILKNINDKEIIFLTGLRRVGKTTILMQVIKHLLKDKKIKPEEIFFVNLDSFNLLEYSVHELIEKYRELHKKSFNDFIYLFLDEVTSRENFSDELKSLYDNENIKVICSSSISTLMRDKKALLTGRTKTIEIMPLNFNEFLLFKNIEINKYEKSKFRGYFRDYLKYGGIPYFVLTKDEKYLKELVDAIIYKDIISHYKIQNEKVIQELFILLCKGVGKPMSYSKIAKILNISIDSVKRYIKYFENAYLFYVIDRYSKSYNERILSPKKIYIGDVGIKNLITGFKDSGAGYENLVYLKLKNLNPNYYYDKGIEIDFITKNQIVEAKLDDKITEKQEKLFNSIKRKSKIIARDYEFFIE